MTSMLSDSANAKSRCDDQVGPVSPKPARSRTVPAFWGGAGFRETGPTVRAVVTAVFLAFACIAVAAEEATPTSQPQPPTTEKAITADAIQTRLSQVASVSGLDDAQKAELTQALTDALNQTKLADEWANKAAQFDQALKSAPSDITDLEAEAQRRPATPKVQTPADATLPQLEQLLVQREGELYDAKAAQAAIEEELGRRDERRKQLPQLVTEAKQRLAKAQAAEGEAPAPTGPPEIAEAKRMLAVAQQQEARNEIAAYEKELQSHDVRGQMLRLRKNAAALRVAETEKLVAAWRDYVSDRRQDEAQKAEEQARAVLLDAANASPEIRNFANKLAAENAALVDRRTGPQGILNTIDLTSAEQQTIGEKMAQVKRDFTGVKQKVDAVGLNNAIGHLLRRYKAQLPDLREHRQAIEERQDVIARVQIDRIELGDERRGLADTEAVLANLLSTASLSEDPKVRARLEGSLRNLLNAKRDTMDALLNDYDSYFDKLIDADSTERDLLAETRQFSDFIDERILWIRSGSPTELADFRSIRGAVSWLADPRHWLEVPRALGADAVDYPIFYPAAGLAVAALLWLRRRLVPHLARMAERAQRPICTEMTPTLDALMATLVLALPAPALLGFIGWRLATGGHSMEFASAVGVALERSAAIVLAFEIVRQVVRPKGLAESHLDWPDTSLRAMGMHLRWVVPSTVAAVFLLTLIQWNADETWFESLGRMLLVVILAAFAAFAHRLLRPRIGAIPTLRNWLNPGRGQRWSTAAYAVGVGLPILLALLALDGYTYTAFKLSARLYETACLAVGLVFIRSVVLRWLLLERRRVAIEQARKRRELARKQDPESAEPEEAADEHELDLAKIDAQTCRIIRSAVVVALAVGAWLLWSDELPALRVLDRIQLWSTTVPIPNVVSNAEGKLAGQMGDATVAVTASDLLTAIIIAAFTWIATANLPGFLELAVLQRLKYRKGERYAITTIARYIIGVIGAVLALNTLGIGWGKVQWLVAALGVGLGFGLQEIFANFVSGLIILIERPIRVGDTVTVGGISGTVTRIRTRATNITDWNRKELIVPNKEFVTNQITNWTLSDSILRIVFPVGIAYGADTDLAEQLLYKLVREHPSILDDPAPTVVFTGFGDSALNFELRAFCINTDYVKAQHELNGAINKAFREAGIEIAFPQRDIHIRSVDGGFPLDPRSPTSTS